MEFNSVPVLEDGNILLTPLIHEHFNQLFEIASDPILWEHHPMATAFEKKTFEKFFAEAINTGSLLIFDKIKGTTIGCTRFYNFNSKESSVVIGHTFISRNYWGTGYNTRTKSMMLSYAFNFVQKVIFYVVKENIRSRKALEKIGAITGDEVTRVYDDKSLVCVTYHIKNPLYPEQ
jgi:RimJ/RimL family protein N-acetyltransferase